MKKRVLVTGDRGFIGSHMVKFLEKKNELVVITTSGLDYRDYDELRLITKGVDWIFHFAADMGGVGYLSKQNYYPPINNFLMDINILRACEENKVKRLFYPASACAYPVYEMEHGLPLTEWMLNERAEPDQMYGWEKLTMVRLMKHSPVDCRIGVLHTIYGDNQEYEGIKAKFIPQIAYKAIKAFYMGVPTVEVWGNGRQTRTFMYIDDAIKRMYKIMKVDYNSTPVNIGSDKEVSINEVVKICCDILNIKPKIVYDESKPVGPKIRRCNNNNFYNFYGKAKEISLKEGLKKVITHIQHGSL